MQIEGSVMNISRIIRKSLLLSVLGLCLGVHAQAATINLGGLNWVTYGDGNSYSLPIANLQYGFNTNTGPYAIDSTPGQIKDLTVLATGVSGQGVTTNTPGIDNAYATPNGVGGATYFYSNTGTLTPNLPNDNGPTSFNGANTWDASVTSLLNFLDGDQMVFFFNNNQVNSGDSSNQELAAWARIWITDNTGAVVPDSTFEFTNNNGKYDIVTNGGGGTFLGNPSSYTAPGAGPGNPDAVAAASTDFVLAGGQLCVAYVPGDSSVAPIPVPCGSSFPGRTVSGAINHNLGADHAAYAVLFPELNAKLAALDADPTISDANLALYTLHFDGRFGCTGDGVVNPWMSSALANNHGTCLNNGYEQIFMGTATNLTINPTDGGGGAAVPEPATLALVGISLIGMAAIRRRRAAR